MTLIALGSYDDGDSEYQVSHWFTGEERNCSECGARLPVIHNGRKKFIRCEDCLRTFVISGK